MLKSFKTLRLLLTALVVGLLALGTLQAPASAATARTLSISANPTAAAVRATVTISGVLSKSPKGSPVTIQRKSGSSWVTAKAVKTTTAAGRYSGRVTLPSKVGTYSFRAVAAAKGSLKAATSPTIKVYAGTPVVATIKASPKPPAALTAGGTATVSGTVKPFVTGTTVTIQRFVSGKYLSTGVTAKVTSKGTYSAKVVVKDGSVFRVSVPRAGTKAPAVSAGTAVIANPKIATTSLPNGSVGAAYSVLLKQVGTNPGTWSVTPALPAGLSLNSTTGRISGTPTGTSSASRTFKFAQPGLVTASKVLSLTVTAPVAPTISTTSLPNGNLGDPYSTTLTAQGNPTGTWTASPLPNGLSLNQTSGVISGTPTAGGTTNVTIGFTQTSTGLSATPKILPLTITQPGPPSITTSSLPEGQVNAAYTATLTAQGNPAGTWTAAPLPTGLSLNQNTGVISGTPTSAGTTNVTIGFTQTSTGLADPSPAVVALKINPPPAPSIRTTSLPNAIQNTAYNAQLEATAGATGTWSVTGGVLPLGINLNPNSGVLSGSSLLVGTYNLTFTFTYGPNPGESTSAAIQLRVVAFQADQYDAIVSAGGTSTCRINQDRTLWCWGSDGSGELGDGGVLVVDPPGQLTPKKIGTETDWTAISVSDDPLVNEAHACALRGTVAYCWGSDAHGMLGNGAGIAGTVTAPGLVTGSLAWQSISAGFTHTCGVTTGGKLYCWGDNGFSQLGTGTGDQADPTQVGTDTNWESVSAGYTSTCAVKGNGSLFCWGSNVRGALGIGNKDSQATPAQVGTSVWSSVQVGFGFACGRQIDGTIWCWGPSSNGQLGNGVTLNDSSTDVTSPLKVGTATNWVSLSTGGSHGCATNVAGELWCWGANGSYQLGDTTTTTRSTPVKIGSATDWQSVSAGESHTCAVKNNGDIWCWGSNGKGKVGTGSAAATVQAPTKVNG